MRLGECAGYCALVTMRLSNLNVRDRFTARVCPLDRRGRARPKSLAAGPMKPCSGGGAGSQSDSDSDRRQLTGRLTVTVTVMAGPPGPEGLAGLEPLAGAAQWLP